MLGCQDFCGYYEWTFHFLRRKFGQESIEKYWREAIAADAQSHYLAAGERSGLRGLYDCWSRTGDSENCDWTVALDEDRNHLRLDMRQCPSKGFLLANDLNADVDYCDHCIGWIGPALDRINAEVIVHEHNHCGQCWWQIGVKAKASTVADNPDDIRLDPRWQSGYVDRFERHQRVPEVANSTSVNWEELIAPLFANDRVVLVMSDASSPVKVVDVAALLPSAIVTDQAYVKLDASYPQPRCIVLGYDSAILHLAANRWRAQSAESRPILLHPFLPGNAPIQFQQFGLPRPVPFLPFLIHQKVYKHRPRGPHPSIDAFAIMLARALGGEVVTFVVEPKD